MDIAVLKSKLEKDFSQLNSDDSTREFEQGISDIVIKGDIEKGRLKKALEMILNDYDTYSYCAFYALNMLYRRDHDAILLKELIQKNKEKFGNKKSFKFLELLCDKINHSLEPEDIINKSYQLSEELPGNSGIIHCFAEIVAAVYEETREHREEIVESWLDKALLKIETALVQDPEYAKFYCTRARLRVIEFKTADNKNSIKTKFKLSISDINKAMNYEDSRAADYVLRLSYYQQVSANIQRSYSEKLLQLKVDEYNEDIKKSKDEMNKKINGITFKNLEFLGFFAALVSFLIGSIEIISNQSFSEALKLIVVLMICLTLVFSFFGLILHEIEKQRQWVIILLGFILLSALVLILIVV